LAKNQGGLLSIEQLRERMPALRQREQTLRAELQAIADRTNDRAAFLHLPETLTAFPLACALPPKRLVSLSAAHCAARG
jgi:site-specific DNA recombinase